MTAVYKTPGVFTKEISLFPPSVAQVETAVPAFVGYTQRAEDRGTPLNMVPTRIKSLADYEELYGAGPDVSVDRVDLDVDNNVTNVSLKNTYMLYDSLRLFFANGGSKCYIVAVGRYGDNIDKSVLSKGLSALARADEPTLILMPDSVRLRSNQHYDLQRDALAQCYALKDRFAILDLLKYRDDNPNFDHDAAVAEFRGEIGVQNLSYGAAYTPWLRTNLPKTVTYRHLNGHLRKLGNQIPVSGLTGDANIQAQLTRLDNAIADVDRLAASPTGILPQFLATTGNDAADVNSGFQALFDAFRVRLAGFRAGDGTTIDNVCTDYRALYDYIYRLADVAVDSVALTGNSATFTQPNTNDPDNTRYVGATAADLITKVLREQLRTLNQYSINADGRIGGGAPSNNLFLNAAFPFDAAEWTAEESGNPVNIFGDNDAGVPDLPALAGPELDAVYPLDPANPPTNVTADDARANNMEHAATLVSAIFTRVEEVVTAILRDARELETRYHGAAVNAFPLLRTILERVANATTELPPSGAIAGVYAAVDAARGVHKAPANVSLNNVDGLAEIISAADQGELNVDSTAGKSINAIRGFIGRGILVWGTRTLDGNSNEWRYVNVRRFFNMVEESTKKASERFVFEPNDKNTWVKVQGMIQNFLLLQWRNGALQGSSPDKAFFVKVGLGQTMTALDILEGRMIVEIGMAVVRPAEFIILRFSHKMAEA